jgi:hypothetical protein
VRCIGCVGHHDSFIVESHPSLYQTRKVSTTSKEHWFPIPRREIQFSP